MSKPNEAEKLESMQAVISNLQNTLGKMEIVLGSIDEAIIYTDKAGIIQWCNAAFDRMVGKSHLMVLGQNLLDLMELVVSDNNGDGNDHPLQILRERGRMDKTTYNYVTNEDFLWLEVSGNVIQVENEKIYILRIQDVTELKINKDELEAATTSD